MSGTEPTSGGKAAPWAAKAASAKKSAGTPAAPAAPAATQALPPTPPSPSPGGGRSRRRPGVVVWSAVGAVVIGAAAVTAIVLNDRPDDDVAAAADDAWAPPQDLDEPTQVPELPTPGGSTDVDEPPAPGPTVEPTQPARPTEPTAAPTPDGSLDVGVPMTLPECDGSWVVFLGAATDPASYESDVRALLGGHSQAKYLLTEGSCTSMRQRLPDGSLIYAVWVGPYPDQAAACSARDFIGGGAYVKRMDNTTPAEQLYQC